ncbi:acyl carrier protein [Polynucleobacter sp.]|jgi:acyl carrier protein|uniref:acyl carrier protein n=1 Tax=Polynucleobacter sp. TaxID=2029855 RepID=UPI0037C4F80B
MEKSAIFDVLKQNLVEFFEVPADKIVPTAKLYEDLDIDSIDAVDLIVRLKKYTNKTMTPEMFKSVRTVQDVVDAIHKLSN